MEKEKIQRSIDPCPICQSRAPFYPVPHGDHYECPVCGNYEWYAEDELSLLDRNQLSAYLAYHAIMPKDGEDQYYTTLDKSLCDKYNQDYGNGDRSHGRPKHIDADILASWYPKSFAEKMDNILLYIFDHVPHLGQTVQFSLQQLYSFLFIDRYELSFGQYVLRPEDNLREEAEFMLTCLEQQNYIKTNILHVVKNPRIQLMPLAYVRIDEIQRNTANGRKAFVAMKFGDDTKPLREAIRKGISDAGYDPIFIDEVPHNNFITPELLKHIRDSRFVVVDLSDQNNGAYFEEGYAMGRGKPVIQLCKDGTELHFDIAQKNTIMWKSEDEIPERLAARIAATIE